MSDKSIMQGYKYLREIEKILQLDNNPVKYRKVLMDLSSKFYSHIPHNVGYSQMSAYIIDTLEKVQRKSDLIDDLIGINRAVE